MKLLTQEIRNRLPKIYQTDGVKLEDKTIHAKFFTPWSNWTWYVFEGEPEGDDFRFFGYVEGFESEMGYFMLSELESVRGPGGLKIERDLYFDPTPFSKIKTH